MKVRFTLDNGANTRSARVEEFDTVKDLNLDEGEWERYTNAEKWKCVGKWADEHIEIHYEEIK